MAATWVGALAFVLGSCAVSGEGEFASIPPADVPFGLADQLAASTTTSTSTTIVGEGSESQLVEELVDVYYILGSGLFKVQTNVASPASPAQALALLGVNPLGDPSFVGLRTAIPANFDAEVLIARGVAQVDASESFLRSLAPTDQRLAIAQIVATLTSRPGIGQVVFTVEDTPIAVPRGRGDVVAAGTPVSFDDYAMLIVQE